ncbi:MAG: hypothetical protein ACP5Q4_02310 [Candidatus Caldatribacteriaceae bacterium]
MKVLDCRGKHYREVNVSLEQLWQEGVREVLLRGVNGQRYLGRGFSEGYIEIEGVPGDDLGMLLNGATIRVKGNAQDGVGNTMNAGKIIVEGDARDIVGFSMRGGKIFIRGDVGYRVGIHMKSYLDEYPVIIVGGSSGDFLGEYMAGGLIIVLGLERTRPVEGTFIASGMHGGKIFIRGGVEKSWLGAGIQVEATTETEWGEIEPYLEEYCQDLGLSLSVSFGDFVTLSPLTTRPYGKIYAY